MTSTIDHCRLLLEEHARQNPLDQIPSISVFQALAAIQKALHERGLEVDLLVRELRMTGESSYLSNCVALTHGDQVMSVHGSVGWEQVGRAAAVVQSTYSGGGFASLGEIVETWAPGARLDLFPGERAVFDQWHAHCAALLDHALLTHQSPAAPAARRPAPRI